MPQNARVEVIHALMRLHRGGGYSHLVVESRLSKQDFSPADRALFTRLLYGVEERRLTLDWLLQRESKMPLHRTHPLVWESLRVGAYQLLFMTRIPPSAAVNESVKAVRAGGQDRAAGYVNGVLRSLARRVEAAKAEEENRRLDELLSDLPTGDEGLSVRTSCPLALLNFWKRAYGEERARELALSLNNPPPVALRLNTLRTTREEWEATAEREGIVYHYHETLPNCVLVDSGLTDGETRKRLDFLEKKCYYQDIASQWCVWALEPRPGERMADVCAAPGGKTLTMAQYMNNEGFLLSGDVHADKVDALSKRATALGATMVETACRDASAPCPNGLKQAFDRVLCDVPCSGLGVIRRKPDIRYKELPSAELPELQFRILTESAEMVRPGGVLHYSTCTLNPEENERVVERFLKEHSEFVPRHLPLPKEMWETASQPDWRITLFPPIHGTDGFFIAGFTRRDGESEETV